MKKKPPVVVLSGASGSGKTSLCQLGADRLGLYHVVSHTTRFPRAGEVEGQAYHFVSRDEFTHMIDAGEFFEWAEVYGNLYGTAKKSLLDRLAKGQGVIMDLDPQGAFNVKKLLPRAILVFIQVPSLEELAKRLDKRGTDSLQTRQARLAQAQKEESFKDQYDHVLVNEDLEETYQKLEKIIY